MNSTGALKQQRNLITTVPIVGQQWIAQYATSATNPVFCAPASSGDVYVVWDQTVIKLNSNGGKTFAIQNSSANIVSCASVDPNGNLYVGAGTEIYKYDSFGSIIWQKAFGGGGSFSTIVGISDNTVFALQTSLPPVTGYFGNTCMYKLTSTGSITNQRKLLKSTTTEGTSFTQDTVNGKLIVTGTNFVSGRGQVITGVYDYSNAGTGSPMYLQSSTTDSYLTAGSSSSLNTIVTDGTYSYQVVYRVISGTTRSVYTKINNSTGAESYSNQITINGTACTIYGITKDTSGYIYVYGNVSSSDTGLGFVSKILASDGSIVWSKTLGFTQQFIWSMSYSGGFLYLTTETLSGGYKSACIKLNSDGSLPNGTYGTNWKFASASASLTSYGAASSTTTTGTNSSTSNLSVTTTYSTSTSSATITTYNIP